MKLILENSNGRLYCYFETERHFNTVEKHRTSTRILHPKDVLDNECDLTYSLPTNSHMVFDLKGSAR